MAMQSHSNPSQAFVIIINPQEHRLRIPSEFMRRHGRSLRDHVSIKAPGGSVRKVGLLRSNGETWIHEGWQEFKDFYFIGSGHLLLFTYDRNLHFNVRIFDVNGMEIEYPHDNPNDDDKGINLDRASARVPETVDVESETDDSFVPLNEISTCRKTQYERQIIETDDCSATQERKKNMSNDHHLRNLKMLNEISDTSPAEKPSKGIPCFSTSAKKISAKKASFPMVKPAFTNMESWGVEVKCGEVLKVRSGDGMVLHLSHACLCELYMRIALQSVCLFVNIDGIKFVLGTLLTNKLPQQQFDVVFDTDFELAHNSSYGSVYFYGYKTRNLFEKDELHEGDIPLTLENNGKPESKSKQEKAGDVEKFKAAREKEFGSGKHKEDFVKETIVKEDIKQGDVKRFLLIGCKGSGTRTIFMQAKFLYEDIPLMEDELEVIKSSMRSNIHRYISMLLGNGQGFMGYTDQDDEESIYSNGPGLRAFSNWLLHIPELDSSDFSSNSLVKIYALLVENLWSDLAFQETIKRTKELGRLPIEANYFLERAVEIFRPNYKPSHMDILHAGGLPSSFSYMDFSFSRKLYDDTDSENQQGFTQRYRLIRSPLRGLEESHEWLDMSEGGDVVIFSLALIDYDQLDDDDNGAQVNKMLLNIKYFESVVTHPSFDQTHVLLLLTKYDLFEEKIERSPLSQCDWFDGFYPIMSRNGGRVVGNLGKMGFSYISDKFKSLYTSLTGRDLYVRHVNNLEEATVDAAFRYAKEILKW